MRSRYWSTHWAEALASEKLQATRPSPPWAAAVEGEELEAATAIEGNAWVLERFCSAGLDSSAASDTQQQKAHKHNNKLDLKEANYQNTSCLHENLMAHVEQSKALSHKVKLIDFLFKATKMRKTTK
jgi:hypothetical protein